MANRCVSPIQGRIMRLTALDVCGVPVVGAGSVIVTEGFVQVQYSPEYQDGTEYQRNKANGKPCVDQVAPSRLRRMGLTIDFCQVNPAALALTAGFELLTTGTDTTGFQQGDDLITNRFALEIWQNVAGDAACSGGDEAFWYWVFPNVGNSRMGDYTVQDDVSDFQLEASTRTAATEWATGPHQDAEDAYVPAAITGHWAGNYTTQAPPVETSCDPIALAA